MQLQKKYLETFYLTLKGTEGVLSLAHSRVRDSFLIPLTEALKTFEEDRKAIYAKFAIKKYGDMPDLADGNYHFKPEAVPEVTKEVEILLNEEVELTPPALLKDIMEQSTYKPKVGEMELIDAVIAKL